MNKQEAVEALRNALRLKQLSYSTEQCYSHWLGRFCDALPSLPGADGRGRVEAFLTALAKRGASATTQNQAFNAILFFYRHVLHHDLGEINALRAKRRQVVRYCPGRQEVKAMLEKVRDTACYPTRLVAWMLYGMGLRVSEPLNLRIRDVLLEQSLVAVRDGKGGKDRIVPIPCALVEPLRRQMRAARVVWERDQQAGLPVALPGLLSKKYPSAQWAWAWFWVFPSHVGCTDPRSGLAVRWRMHEINVQRAVREAAAAADVGGMVTPHCLRHAYATHAMQGGAYVRDVQEVMGHASLETTMGYLHAEAGRVVSPLEGMSHELVSSAAG